MFISEFLQHYQTGCAFYAYTTVFFNETPFPTLRRLHCIHPSTPHRLPDSAAQPNTVLAPLPAHSGAQITCPLQSFYCYIRLRLPGNGFVYDFARYVIAARQMGPLAERKSDSKESGIAIVIQ